MTHTPIPRSPAFRQDNSCPGCGGPLAQPSDGLEHTPIEGMGMFTPSMVCLACGIGYWNTNTGWVAVSTFPSVSG
jgi:uncharacterized protein with PIN domain